MTHLLVILFGIGTLLAWCYYLVCVTSARHWRNRPKRKATHCPPVSILIPLRGEDPEQIANFRSFCQLDYPCFQLIFGALDPDDPGLKSARQIAAEYPDGDIRVVAGGDIFGNNRKVSNLLNMLPAATHDLLVLCDSDMRVTPDYLYHIVAPFAEPSVGLVTCLYRGHRALNITSALQALGIGANFLPGVLLVERTGGLRFGLGATLALSRATLESVGGFCGLVDELADDYRLGQWVYRAGGRIALADHIVDTVIGHEQIRDMWSRRLRWARTVRAMQSVGWTANFVTYGLVHSLFFLLATHGSPLGWAVLATTLALRFGSVAYIAACCASDRETLRWLWMLPVSDLLEFALWTASFCGRTIIWRGERFRLLPDGRLERLEPAPAPEAA